MVPPQGRYDTPANMTIKQTTLGNQLGRFIIQRLIQSLAPPLL